MTDYDETELKAREILDRIHDGQRENEGWQARQALRIVFRAMWTAALPVDRIVEITKALTGFAFTDENFKKPLAAAVRAGILRSRREGGQRLYEINY